MKIGKTITTHTSPKREVRKSNETKERPIPVYIPEKEKVPEHAQADFKFMGRLWFGVDRAALYGDRSFLITSVTS